VIQNGINHTSKRGKALTAFSGKIQPANDSAVELNKLGYWTDNLTTYYYYYVGTYISTLLAVRDEFKTNNLALGYLQLDSWWYPKGFPIRGRATRTTIAAELHLYRRPNTFSQWSGVIPAATRLTADHACALD